MNPTDIICPEIGWGAYRDSSKRQREQYIQSLHNNLSTVERENREMRRLLIAVLMQTGGEVTIYPDTFLQATPHFSDVTISTIYDARDRTVSVKLEES